MKTKIEISNKLNEYHLKAKELYKHEFNDRIEPYSDILSAVMRSNNESELEALIRISGTNTFKDNLIGQLLFYAATVESIKSKLCGICKEPFNEIAGKVCGEKECVRYR